MSDNSSMPEDPAPDENRKGDMGKGSFEQSMKPKKTPDNVQGPRRVPIPKQRSAKK